VYSGCQALAASNAAKAGIRFLTFETVRDHLDQLSRAQKDPHIGRKPWINVVSGLSAGVAESILVVTPGESLKTKMIHDASHGGHRFVGRSLVGTAGIVIREEGIRGLWSGCLPVLLKQGTNSAVRFTTFAMLQEQVAARWPGAEGGLGSSLLLGAISGVVTVYASMPFDNLKTRMQASNGQYRGVVDCAVQTLKAEGALSFWKGTSPRLVRLIVRCTFPRTANHFTNQSSSPVVSHSQCTAKLLLR
jgi:solute carrier family 25 citrate transporter 1